MENNNKQIVAVYPWSGSRLQLMDVDGLVKLFLSYNNGYEGFFYFCKDKRIWRSPNADMERFNFDPIDGSKINWDTIYESNKGKFKEYTPELETEYTKTRQRIGKRL